MPTLTGAASTQLTQASGLSGCEKPLDRGGEPEDVTYD